MCPSWFNDWVGFFSADYDKCIQENLLTIGFINRKNAQVIHSLLLWLKQTIKHFSEHDLKNRKFTKKNKITGIF